MSRDAAVLADALHARGAVTVRRAELLGLWASAAPRLVGRAEQLRELDAVLKELTAAGVIELPRAARRSAVLDAPVWVRVPANRRPARDPAWKRYPWRAELGWVATLSSLTDARFADLQAVNRWLARRDLEAGTGDGTDELWVGHRQRSVEIFGDEKRLDALAVGALFGPGRLSFALLGCRKLAPPLAVYPVGPGTDLLVLENSDAFWAAYHALAVTAGHRIGAVVWGAGRTFCAQASALAVVRPELTDPGWVNPTDRERAPIPRARADSQPTVWYAGDLDPAGVTIALDAADAARSVGVRLRPASALWARLATAPVQESGTVEWSGIDGERAAAWFGDVLWAATAGVRRDGGRVAQERVTAAELVSWATGLSTSR